VSAPAFPASRPSRWLPAEIIEILPETPRVSTLRLRVPAWPGHVAGQHVDVRLTADDGYQAQRSYSIASAPGSDVLDLTIERLEDGEVSPYLTELAGPGDRFELRGPIGGWFIWEHAPAGPLQFVAGGSGIVPIMAMLRHRARIGDRVPARLLYSSRSFEEIIYREELAALCAGDDTLRVVHTLTRLRPPDWAGFGRRIDAAMLQEIFRTPDSLPLTYVCGPTAMVEAAANAFVDLGHDPARIRTERFGPT
jgi:ferredoxin-NADP reductase